MQNTGAEKQKLKLYISYVHHIYMTYKFTACVGMMHSLNVRLVSRDLQLFLNAQ